MVEKSRLQAEAKAEKERIKEAAKAEKERLEEEALTESTYTLVEEEGWGSEVPAQDAEDLKVERGSGTAGPWVIIDFGERGMLDLEGEEESI